MRKKRLRGSLFADGATKPSGEAIARQRGTKSLALRQKNDTDAFRCRYYFFRQNSKKGFVVGAVVNEAPVELQSRE